jgi:hypothetical protein
MISEKVKFKLIEELCIISNEVYSATKEYVVKLDLHSHNIYQFEFVALQCFKARKPNGDDYDTAIRSHIGMKLDEYNRNYLFINTVCENTSSNEYLNSILEFIYLPNDDIESRFLLLIKMQSLIFETFSVELKQILIREYGNFPD